MFKESSTNAREIAAEVVRPDALRALVEDALHAVLPNILAEIARPVVVIPEATLRAFALIVPYQQGEPWTVADLVSWTDDSDVLRREIEDACPFKHGSLARRLGQWMPALLPVQLPGLRLRQCGEYQGSLRYIIDAAP